MNFNAQVGCQKCCTVGIHSTLLRCTIFPETKCALRTNEGFRQRLYEDHHRNYITRGNNGRNHKEPIITPLLRLPIDMVEDITVADSLHLLHLGIMKRLIGSYKDGHNGCNFKFSATVTAQLSSIITQQDMPVEIHRAVRGIDVICHWKASECAVLLNYIGIGALKYVLPENHYKMFLHLFCAVTICSSNYYRRFLSVAHKLFESFIANHYRLFKSVTSNVHNLIHVSQECARFGSLPSFSAYPFENQLFTIRKLIRSGRQPLAQVVNRLAEMMYANEYNSQVSITKYPQSCNAMKHDSTKYLCIKICDGFTLTSSNANKWFLTKKKEVVAFKYVEKTGIFGELLNEFNNVFSQPFNSSILNIFQTDNSSNVAAPKKFAVNDILCTVHFHKSIGGRTTSVSLH